MDDHLLLDIVLKYIDAQEKRNGRPFSKVQRNDWIIGDVIDELGSINKEFRNIKNDNVKENFKNTIINQFKTEYFRKFLKNKSETPKYYNNLLNDCIIHPETIDDFFKEERKSSPITLDFFRAFCKIQQREYEEEISSDTTLEQKKQIPNDLKNETLQIIGATIINEEFIRKIKSGKAFTMPEFYTAKQNEACQWYGIIAGYDVQREIYPQIKNIAKESFESSKSIKVSAVIYGAGGVGKSTILRRIAVELAKEPFTVLWIKDTHIREFIQNDIPFIEKHPQDNYLLIVEDWYRIFQNDYGLESQFLARTDSLQNVRVIVGDRYMEGKKFMEHLNNRSNTFLLGTDENEKILAKIIDKFPQWRKKFNDLFIHESHYHSSLFLLLFVLARITENEDHSNLDLSEPETAFINIITNDLEYIYRHPNYQGIAKALYYWSCIYSKHRVFITYETFLKIADSYQKTNNLSEYLSWDVENTVMERLKLYINIDNTMTDEYNNPRGKRNYILPNFILFNHDILSDKGISVVQSENLGFFSNLEKKQLLDIITDFGDDVSASYFLNILLREESGILEKTEQKKHYFNKLISKKNTHNAYLSYLFENKAYKTDFKEFLDIIYYDPDEAFQLEDNLVKILEDSILEDEDWKTIDGFYVFQALLGAYREDFQKFAEKVLREPDWRSVDSLVFDTCLEKCTNEKLKKEVCNKILNICENEVIEYGHQIYTALKESYDKTIKQDWAIKILTYPHWERINSFLIYICLRLCAIPSIQEKFCENVLLSDIKNEQNLHYTFNYMLQTPFNAEVVSYIDDDDSIFFNPLVIKTSDIHYFDILKQKFIDRFFDHKDSVESCQRKNNYGKLLITALDLSINHTLKQKYSEQILHQQSYDDINPEIICRALEISINSESTRLVLNKILNGEYMDELVFFTTLKILPSEQLALFYIKRQNFDGVKLPRISTIEYKNILLSLSVLQESRNSKSKEVSQLRRLISDYPFSSNAKKEGYHNQMNKKFYDLLLEWNEISMDIYKTMVIDTYFKEGTDSLFNLYDYLEINSFEDF